MSQVVRVVSIREGTLAVIDTRRVVLSKCCAFALQDSDRFTWVVQFDETPLGWVETKFLLDIDTSIEVPTSIPKQFRALPTTSIGIPVIVPRWSHLALDGPEWEQGFKELVRKVPSRTAHVLGVPRRAMLRAMVTYGLFSKIVVIGNTSTMNSFGPGSSLRKYCEEELGLDVELWRTPVREFEQFAFNKLGKSLAFEAEYLLVHLTNWPASVSRSIAKLAIAGAGRLHVNIGGPSMLARSLPPRAEFIDSFNAIVEAVGRSVTMVGGDRSCCRIVDDDLLTRPPPSPVVVEDVLGGRVFSGSQIVARWGMRSNIVSTGIPPEDLRREADEYVAGLVRICPKPIVLHDALPYNINLPTPSQDTVDDDINQKHWINQATAGDQLVIIGEMSGGSTVRFHQEMYGDYAKLWVLEAGRAWDNHWGSGKLAFFHEYLPMIDELLTGTTTITLPLLVAAFVEENTTARVIYHDASHTADDTLADMEFAWRALAVGGVLIVDDFVYHETTGDSPEGEAVYAGKRGIYMFMFQHAGDYDMLPPLRPTRQIAFRKIRATVRLYASEDIPFVEPDRTTLYMGNQPNPDLRPGMSSLLQQFGAPAMAMAASGAKLATSIPKQAAYSLGLAATSVVATGFDVARSANVNVGRGFEIVGEWIGNGQQDNALAGLGQAVKSGGNALKITGDAMGNAALWTANLFVPKGMLGRPY